MTSSKLVGVGVDAGNSLAATTKKPKKLQNENDSMSKSHSHLQATVKTANTALSLKRKKQIFAIAADVGPVNLISRPMGETRSSPPNNNPSDFPPSRPSRPSQTSTAPKKESVIFSVGDDYVLPTAAKQSDSTTNGNGNSAKSKSSSQNNGQVSDNFVRLNMKSKGATKFKSKYASKGANKNRHSDRRRIVSTSGGRNGGKWGGQVKVSNGGDWSRKEDDEINSSDDDDERLRKASKKFGGRKLMNAGVDPVDDFLDGAYSKAAATKATTMADDDVDDDSAAASKRKMAKRRSSKPYCVRHTRPCKLLVVKKSGPNQGRKFYACSLPRGEQCDHFQWAEDTAECARMELRKSKTKEGWVARQVQSWVKLWQGLTVPELKEECLRRDISCKGSKKADVLGALTVWVESEITNHAENEAVKKSFTTSTSEETKKNLEDDDNDRNDSNERNDNGEDDGSPDESADSADSADSSDESFIEGMNETATLWAKTSCGGNSEDEDQDGNEKGEKIHDSSSSSDDDAIVPKARRARAHAHAPPQKSEKNNPKAKDITESSSNPIVKALNSVFCHCDFRPGQAWAINRCLGKQRSMLVMATGGGKSLTYALPASLSPGVTIVVSPLISLMQDQLRHLPPRVPAATLSGNLTATETATIIDDIINCRIKILFVSPERLCSSSFKRLLKSKWDSDKKQMVRQLPPVSILCVDEAHCLSQWSHNFRPSYMRLKGVMSLMKPESVLALTATAGENVIDDVCHTLDIPRNRCSAFSDTSLKEKDNENIGDPARGVRVLSTKRANIDTAVLVVDSDDARRMVLFKMLCKPPPSPTDTSETTNKTEESLKNLDFGPGILSKGSVIIYCWRKKDCEALCEQLIGAGVEGGCTFYHGGMTASQRATNQSQFLRNKKRVIVATVAFGLGIDKPDVRGVIHVCLPNSLEHYLQEIGRAGRDGKGSVARALICAQDASVHHSLGFSSGICASQIRCYLDLMRQAFQNHSSFVPKDVELYSFDIAVSIRQLIDSCDLKDETSQTLLSLLEEEEFGSLLVYNGKMSDVCVITLKKRELEKLSEKESIARLILQCGKKLGSGQTERERELDRNGGTAKDAGFNAYCLGNWRFSIVQCASLLGSGGEPRHVYAALRRLEKIGEIETHLDSGINGSSHYVTLTKNGVDFFRDVDGTDDLNLIEKLLERMNRQQRVVVEKVEQMWKASFQMHKSNIREDEEGEGITRLEARNAKFVNITAGYFDQQEDATNDDCDCDEDIPPVSKRLESKSKRALASDVSAILNDSRLTIPRPAPSVTVGDRSCDDYSALIAANLLHGIESPRLDMRSFWNHALWGKWKDWDYRDVAHVAASVTNNTL